ncbi:unnamed protein product [Discosporangium mesarthrocarpum]
MSSGGLGGLLNRPINVQSIFKTNDISTEVQGHLANVYAALMSTVIACAAGVVTDLWLHVGGLVSTLAGLGALLWLAIDQDKHNQTKRVGILLLFGLLQGLSLGRLVEVVLEVDPSILITSVLATAVVFGCFSGSALISKRRSYLYLGGLLSSALMVMSLASLLGLFVRVPFLFSAQLYIGLAVFCGYVMFDTQMIVEKASLGDSNVAWHAAELFVDLVGIFVRICIILLDKTEKKKGSGKGERSHR